MANKGKHVRQYTEEEREEAIALAEMVCNEEAASTLGIPLGTIGTWRAAYRKLAKAAKTRSKTKKPAAHIEPKVAKPEVHVEAVEQFKGSKTKKGVARVYTPSQRAEALEMMRDKGPVEQLC